MAATPGSSSRIEAFDLVVAGAGVGALTLANYLAPLGFRILILDKRTGFDPVHRGELVQPLGLEILDDLSLLPQLLSLPHSIHRSIRFLNGAGELLMASDYALGEGRYPYAVSIEPHQMDRVLATALSPYPQIVLRFGAEFQDLEVTPDGVVVSYTHSGTIRQAIARVIVGDDGRHSRVRETAKFRGSPMPYRDSYLGGSLLLPENMDGVDPALADPAGRYFLGPRFIFFLFSVSPVRRFFLHLLPDRDRDAFFAKGIDPVLARLDRLVPGFSRGVRESGMDRPEVWTELPVFKVDLETWCQDGVVLIGDAAHAMNPHVAQGRNQAMEDGRVLAPILASALLAGPLVLRAALRPFEDKRLPVTKKLHRLADEMTRVWNSGHPLVVWGRERAFRGLGRTPSLGRKIVTTIGGTAVLPLSPGDKLRALLRGRRESPLL